MANAGPRRGRRVCNGRAHRVNTRTAHRKRILEAWASDKGQCLTTIARKARVDPHTVKRTLTRWREDSTIDTKHPGPKPGSHTKGKQEAINEALLLMIGRGGLTAKMAAAHAGVSEKTMRRAAHYADITYDTGRRKATLSEEQRLERLGFARKYKAGHTGISWRRGFYVDSTPVYMAVTRGKQWVAGHWNWAGLHPQLEVEAHPAKLMIYAAICAQGATTLHIVTGTTDQVSEYKYAKGAYKGTPHRGCCGPEYKVVARALQQEGNHLLGTNEPWLYVHDKASIHNVVNTMFKQEGQAVVADWPAKGFDINVIENAWSMLQRDVWQRGPYLDMAEFKAAVQESWQATMTQDVCKKLCRGVPSRLKQIIAKKGHHIKY